MNKNKLLRHAAGSFSVLALLALVSRLPSQAAEWHHYRGPNYDGISDQGEIVPGKIEELWKASVGTGFASIVAAGNAIYTMGNENQNDIISALDAQSGKVLWKFSYPSPLDPNMYEGGPNSTPTFHEGKVYALSKTGTMVCLNAADGKEVWTREAKEFGGVTPSWGFSGPPTIVGPAAIFNVGSGGLALDKDSGKTIWQSSGAGAGYAPAIPFTYKGKPAVALFTAAGLLALNPADGKEIFTYPWKTSYDVNAASPLFFDNKVFISSGYNTGCVLIDLSGDQPVKLWQNRSLRNHFQSSVYFKGYIYGIDGDSGKRARLVCMDPTSGEEKWSEKVEFGNLLIADGKLITLNSKGKLTLAAAKPDAYEEIFNKDILEYKCWTVPTVYAGKLYARNAAGQLTCLSLGGN